MSDFHKKKAEEKANKKLVFSSDCHDVKNLLFGYDICLKKVEKREI